jgi:hypothetical protein
MGFRNPITTAIDPVARQQAADAADQAAFAYRNTDTRPGGPGVRIYDIGGVNPGGSIDFRSAIPGTNPGYARLTGYTDAGGAPIGSSLAIRGQDSNGKIPGLRLNVENVKAYPAYSAMVYIDADYTEVGTALEVAPTGPRSLQPQETQPGSLVRYDSAQPATPTSADFTGPANGVTNGTLTNLPNAMTRARAAGPTTLAVPAGGQVSLPAGLWLVTWEIALSGGTINGRSFLQALNGAAILARAPLYDVGEDNVCGSFFFALTATTAVTFQFFLTLTASPFNTAHTLRLVRLGNA